MLVATKPRLITPPRLPPLWAMHCVNLAPTPTVPQGSGGAPILYVTCNTVTNCDLTYNRAYLVSSDGCRMKLVGRAWIYSVDGATHLFMMASNTGAVFNGDPVYITSSCCSALDPSCEQISGSGSGCEGCESGSGSGPSGESGASGGLDLCCPACAPLGSACVTMYLPYIFGTDTVSLTLTPVGPFWEWDGTATTTAAGGTVSNNFSGIPGLQLWCNEHLGAVPPACDWNLDLNVHYQNPSGAGYWDASGQGQAWSNPSCPLNVTGAASWFNAITGQELNATFYLVDGPCP
jgi:hypothetical protein